MTIWKEPGRRTYRYRFFFRKQRYEGSTNCTSEGAARRFEEAFQRELELEAGGLVPHRLLKVDPSLLVVAEDGTVRVDDDRSGVTAAYADRLRAALLEFLNTPIVTAGITGVVYFIGAGGLKPIKIGYATDVGARLRLLKTANPDPLEILITVPGSKRVEQHVHGMFGEFRIEETEWFRSGDALLAFVRLLRDRPIIYRRIEEENLQSPEASADSSPETLSVND